MFLPKLVKLIFAAACYWDCALKFSTLKINISTLARPGSPKIGSRIDNILNNVLLNFTVSNTKF